MPARLIFDFLYNINYSGYEKIPKTGPVLLVAKHQSLLDIILEGVMLYQHVGRAGNWVMKDSLPKFLELWGGIPVKRPRDLRINGNSNRKELLEKSRQQNKDSERYIEWLYTQNEIVVAHPEGTRLMGAMRNIRPEMIDLAREVEYRHSISIPIVPVGLEYLPSNGLRGKIYVRVGERMSTQDSDVVGKVYNEIKKLSNL